jgi:UV DNA damage endonuclease
MRLGYPTQNLSIPASTNRTLRLENLGDTEKLRSLIRENISGLRTIARWNYEHGYGLFRIGQNLIPFASHPEFPYDWRSEHTEELREAGDLANSLNIRLSMHPGQYIQPGSPRQEVRERSIQELRYVAEILRLLDSRDGVIVLHLGGAHGDKSAAAERLVETLAPEKGVLPYLALENDEQTWGVPEAVEVARSLGVPAITDNLHHRLNPADLTLKEALDLTLPTWQNSQPKLHLSSQNSEKQPGTHAYYIDGADYRELLEALDDRDADVMVEAKGKEQAILVS